MSSKKMVTTRNKSLTPAVMRKKGHATIDVNENCATKLKHHMWLLFQETHTTKCYELVFNKLKEKPSKITHAKVTFSIGFFLTNHECWSILTQFLSKVKRIWLKSI